MFAVEKITVGGVLSEGFAVGLKNAPSLVLASILWMLTIWIPYLNVGTTIAMCSVPVELSKGKIISPAFIFDSKYRRYMGEFFTLLGLMMMSLTPAFLFMFIPGYIIALGWSLAIYMLLDKGLSPSEALVQSNNATYGYKMTIFLVNLIIGFAFFILFYVFALIPFLGILLILALMICYMPISLGCSAIIYRNLVNGVPNSNNEPVQPITGNTIV